MCVPAPSVIRECIRTTVEEMPDPGSRASSPPTTCQVFLGWLQEEGHLEPLNQFKQEELDDENLRIILRFDKCAKGKKLRSFD